MIKRPRRLRKTEILRKMVRETRIDQASLIYPMFVRDGEGIRKKSFYGGTVPLQCR